MYDIKNYASSRTLIPKRDMWNKSLGWFCAMCVLFATQPSLRSTTRQSYTTKLPGTMLFLKRSRVDWNYTGEYDEYVARCHQKPYFEMSQGKVLGGTSSINYLNYDKGLPSDYDYWAQLTNDDTWKWSNVLEYMKKTERLENPETLQSPDRIYHGTEGELKVTADPSPIVNKYLEAVKEAGNNVYLDLNEKHSVGFTKLMLTVADGVRQSTAYAFLRAEKVRPNLFIAKHTTATRILFDDNKNAVGVECVTKEGLNKTFYTKRKIILSAGAFGSAKLLMLSGIGPRNHLESHNIKVISDLPVGQTLQDHLAISLLHNMEKVDGPFAPIDYQKNAAPQTLGYVSMNNSKTNPDYMALSFFVNPNMILGFCAFGYRYKSEICDSIYKLGEGRNMIFHQIVKFNPYSRGSVLLRSANYNDTLIINTNYMSNKKDFEDIVKYVKHFSRIENTTYFKSINAELIDPTGSLCGHLKRGSDEHWECFSACAMTGLSHYTSTCPMTTVTDSRLRVKGVNGLLIGDASVMPRITAGSPLAAVMMIAEKVSEFVKEK